MSANADMFSKDSNASATAGEGALRQNIRMEADKVVFRGLSEWEGVGETGRGSGGKEGPSLQGDVHALLCRSF